MYMYMYMYMYMCGSKTLLKFNCDTWDMIVGISIYVSYLYATHICIHIHVYVHTYVYIHAFKAFVG